MVSLEVTFLGTSAAMPTVDRSLSSVVVNRNGTLHIFDAGEGMQYNFIRASLGFNKRTMLFITHLHSDHILGILGFLQTLSLQGRTMPIDIFGPEPLYDFIIENFRLLNVNLTFQINIHKILDSQGTLVEEKEYKILYCKSEHGPGICSYAYCLLENDRPGKFDIRKAKELGIPEGEMYGLLQKGFDIVDKNRVIHSSEIVGQKRPGRKIGISGDTRPSENLCSFFRNCDLLIFESTFSINELTKAKESYHSTALETATLAKMASVQRLCLTHFSSRYKDLNVLLNEARSVFLSTEIAFDLKLIRVDYRS
ncbi:ribonuclease Z [Candidatus Nitrosocosmicus franklandus]|uniref:Ribonuclease Z n=1 Tax=Candidatus Nitrosocosmicus franklandianus TaxID=1798806 RepID=A0A484ICE0_9ARCH|nr:ribonuclease Z [Candidatus Nitrosocosmicus franklandus]VFJ13715.1 Ribonuclease Z [Candidatus Nitrosocosmicus franklandus]